MTDGELRISKSAAFAVVAYGVAVALMLLMWVTGDRRLGLTGLFVSSMGAVAMVRTYFVRFDQLVRNSFELGRDSVRSMRRP